MRVITLTINTMKMVDARLILRGSHFFDLLGYSTPDLLPILEANAGEFLVRDTEG